MITWAEAEFVGTVMTVVPEDVCAIGAGVVSSAAVIMVAVFSIFATLSVIEFKMFGVGMASAVLIDATVVRGILMPAVMSLLGERNWYLPHALRWLPGGGAVRDDTAELPAVSPS